MTTVVIRVKRGVLAPANHSCENCGRFHPWRYRLKVRTEPSQGSNPGSSPGIATTKCRGALIGLLYVARLNSLLFEILLVIFLGTVKLRSWSYLRNDRPFEHSLFNQDILGGASGCFLLRIVKKYSRAILRAHVWALAIECRGVVAFPEDSEKREVRTPLRIEFHLHGFGVARVSAANILVCGILQGPAGITDCNRSNARELWKRVFHAPKTSCCECSPGHDFSSLN